MKKHVSLIIKGRVQGVFFRESAKQQAQRLGITGFVKNCDDGSVCIEAEGHGEMLEEFTAWCRKGPKYARVDSVEHLEKTVIGYSQFEIQ